MTSNIEDTPFLKMRRQFIKEKDVIVARYEDEIRQLKARIVELESRDQDNIVDVSPANREADLIEVNLDEPFFDIGEDNES